MTEERRYDHKFHAGNVGDVWKHVGLVALLERYRDRTYLDTHAGAGEYVLGPTGEWTEGVGVLRKAALAGAPPAVERYLRLVGQTYPGSPKIAAACLGEERLRLYERDDAVRARLAKALPKASVTGGDGLLALGGANDVVLVDPTWEDRAEWTTVPEAIVRAKPEGPLLLWYPIKSYARPNAMLERFDGLGGAAVELITSPLTSKKNRLNGSGLVVFGTPPDFVEELARLATWLGPRVAIFGGWFTVRVVGLR